MISNAKTTGYGPESYWKKRLIALQPLTLPINQLEILVSGKGAGGEKKVAIPQEIGTRPAILPQTDVLVAAFSAFLSRFLNIYSFDIKYADTSMLHNCAVSGETSLKYLPLHVDLDSENTFEEVCNVMQEELRRLSEYGNSFLDVLSENSDLRTALDDFEKTVSISFVLVDSLEDFKSFNNKQITLIIPKYGSECMCFYDDSVFNQNRISRLLHHFDIFLRGIISNPSLRISELPLLNEKDQEQLLCEFNDTKMKYPKDKLLQDMFEEQVEKTPNSDAVIFKDKKITYKELNECSNQLARRLRERGVRQDQIVGLMVDDNSIEMTIGMISIVKAGGAFLPIDPNHPKDRIEYMIADSNVAILISQTKLKDKIQFGGEAIYLEKQSLFTGESSNLDKINQPNDLVYVIYTSGSTGKPKGVQIEHTSIVNQIYGLKTIYKFESSLHHILLASITFDPSVQQIFLPLTTGGKLFLVPKSTKQSVKALWEFIVSNQIDIVNTVPSLMSILLDYANSYSDLHFKYIILAGEVLSNKLYLRLKESLSAEKIINIYGPTEATINATLYECKQEEISSSIPIGKPLMNYNIMILDAHQNLLPIDVPGEICISGVGLARGYLNNPKLTAEKFISNPFIPGERIYRTGDLGRWTADGNIEFFGRIDHQVKIRGIRIELGEIEAALGQHPAIKETVVIEREDHAGSARLVAYVVPKHKQNVTIDELRRFLKDKLPDYMVPSAFVALDSLPLTANGKVDRGVLPEPEWGRHNLGEPFVSPRTSVEELLANIWREVLGLKQVGIHANFFELGGDSLSAIRIIARIQDATGINISPVDFFEAPNVAGLALRIEQAHAQSSGLNLPPVRPHTREQTAPLSFGQQEIWLSHQLWPDVPVYNEPETIYLKGPVDAVTLEKAFIRLIRRHEILRTFFITEGGVPVQAVREEPIMELRVVDLQSVSISDREDAALQYATEEARRPFDLAKAPLFRASLVRLDNSDYRLYLVLHHIVTDGFSIIQVLVPELWVHYEAVRKGIPSPLLELTVRYNDYAMWQRELLHTSMLEEHFAYWRAQLDGMPPLDLPTDRTRPPTQTFRGSFQTLDISKELTHDLKALGRREGCTLYMVLLAAFKVLLWRYTHQDDLAVGTVDAGRARPELEPLLGYFLNMLVIRTNPSSDLRFKEFLHQVRKVALEAYVHKDLPFITLVEALKLPRDPARHPLFQVAFVMEPTFSAQESGWTVSQLEVQNGTAKFDLTLELGEREDHIIGRFEYSTDLFDTGTIQRMAIHYQRILEGIASNPDQRLSELPLLTDDERHRMLVEWNDTATEYPRDKRIHELFEEQVEKTPDAIAVVFIDHKLTYRELNCRANQLAHYLIRKGVGPETMIGICAERSIEMIIALLAVLKAGGAYVPLDPAYPQERLRLMMEDANISVLLTQEHLCGKIPAGGVHPVCLDSSWNIIAWESEDNPINRAIRDNAAYVIFTSGSTGKPKGVLICHSNLVHSTHARLQYYRQPVKVFLLLSSFGFDSSVAGIFWTLLQGGALFLLPAGAERDPNQLVDAIARNCISHLLALPSLYELILQQGAAEQLVSLRTVIVAGEACSREVAERHRRLLPAARFFNEYGPTEGTVWSMVYEVGTEKLESQVPIGRPIPNMQVYILDRNRQPVPIRVPGELLICGDGLARGYLNYPDLTAEKFIPNPFSEKPGERLYKTGDFARYLPDGNIEFLGRIDYQVKIRGFRIELGEIEAILGQHPAVRENIVIAREDQPGDKRLVAYVTIHQGSIISTKELRNILREKLPEYMVPSAFVILDTLPLTPNGKVDRKALSIHDPERSGPEDSFVEPRTPTEELLAGIWCEVLGLKKVGIHDNFFELGGHSLLATQVISRLRNAFQVEIPLRRLFESPTVAGMDEAVSTALISKKQQPVLPMTAVSREGGLPLSFAQERLWFLDQLEPDSSAYNIPLVLRLTGDLNIAALEESIGEVLRRHEVLRTTFVTENNQPVQSIAPAKAFTLSQADLSAMPYEQREIKAHRLASEEASCRFDLTKGPLLRATLLRLDPQEHVLLLTVHHIISDAWSMGILYRELSALYKAFLNGIPAPLPELPVQYADFAIWQRQWLQEERLEEQLMFWKEQLTGVSPLELPADRPRPSMQTFCGAAHCVEFPESLTEALRGLSRNEGVTLFMTLLTAFQCLLHRYTGQDDIVVGTPIANRNHAEIEGLIGFFVNTQVMRTNTSGDPVFRELLKQVRKTTLDAYTHQDLPFEKLVEELQPERDLGRNPLFQVMFALQNVPHSALELSGLTLSRMEIENTRTPFDLEVHLRETGKGLKGTFVYNTDLFDRSTIQRMAIHYQRILEGIASNPDQRLSELPLLTDDERYRMLVEWNDTATEYPRDKRIHELFEEQVKRVPDNVAVVFKDKKITYRELNERANQLAKGLRSAGVRPDVIVGIMVHRSIEMISGILGILKAGGAYLPIDPDYPDSRIEYMLKDSDAPVLLTQKNLINRLAYNGKRIALDRDSFMKEDASDLDETSSPDDLACVIYTSGSTGIPKGVMLEHIGVVNLAAWFNKTYDLSKNSNVIQNTTYSFDVAVEEIFATLTSGASLFIPGKEEILDKDKFLTFVRQNRINIAQFVPITLREFLADTDKIEDLNIVICGGETLDGRLKEKILPKGYTLYNNYGPTEITVDALSAKCGMEKVTIGKPVSNKKCYILDERFNPVPIGVAGELYIGGTGLARGYLNRPELTAEKFIPNSFSDEPAARLYKTGDLARYLSDGSIEFLGRIDYQVKVRGFRIEPGEIESALGQHPDVRETAVIAQEDQWGNKRLIAYVVFNQNAAILTSELRSFLKEKLPDYMMPSAFAVLDSLPLTSSGKLDRRALPAPDSERPGAEDSYVAPRTPIEEVLTGIWCEILGLKQIGIHDNFFELGGHSLLATQVMSRLRKVFEIEIPLRTLFESPTVEKLAISLLQREGEREKVEQRAALLLKVAELSDDEVNTMLAEQIRKRHNKENE